MSAVASSAQRLRILALEPYYGGSHRAVLDDLVSAVDAEWTLLTLPARKWKWRMRGAAITMAAQARAHLQAHEAAAAAGAPWDVVFASTFVNLAEFRGLAGARIASIPALVYFHENQLVYPNRHEAEWDYQFPLTNITSALSAERCLFNTRWNLERFIEEVDPFLRRFPDHQPRDVSKLIAAKSAVLPPPFDAGVFDAALPPVRSARPRIIWPHRWEHDKGPDAFFAAVTSLAAEGLQFEVVVAGQEFKETSGAMQMAAAALGDRLVHAGEPGSRTAYAKLLRSADIAVSTARNEFYGLAMIESCYAGCYPLVPDRLAYPEIYPPQFRYASQSSLLAKLRSLIAERPAPDAARALALPLTLERLAPAYARELTSLVAP